MRDLIVVGGGPAGLATAIEAARRGLRVALVERREGMIDKACGEGLMPGAWQELGQLGVSATLGHPLAGIRYRQGAHEVEAPFPSEGRGLRRTTLHHALRDLAAPLAIERIAATVHEVEQRERSVCAAGLEARYLVAADGLRSTLRTTLGLDRATRWPARYGVRRHFAVPPWTSHVEVHWAADAEAYVTPVDRELVGVAFLFGDRARQTLSGEPGPPFDKLLARFPDLQARLHTPVTRVRGAGPFAHRAARRVHHRVLLVGDAAGYLDPLTGEGLKLGMRGARAAVRAIVSGHPERYEAAWRRLYAPYAATTGGLLLATRGRWARARLVPLLARAPWLMASVVQSLAR